MSDIIIYILRPLGAFIILMVTTRTLGKQTISRMTLFDFATTISLGAMTANIAFNTTLTFWHLILSYVTFAAIGFLNAFISLKSRKARKILAGDPTVVIQNGKILEHNMRKMRYTLDYLNQELREQNIFDIHEVLYAILEINGSLTVLKKPQYRLVNKQDLWIHTSKKEHLAIELIMDGKIQDKILQANQIERVWIDQELKKRNVTVKDVCYAVLGPNDALYIDTYDDHIQSPVDQE